jgi:hypothetical protein
MIIPHDEAEKAIALEFQSAYEAVYPFQDGHTYWRRRNDMFWEYQEAIRYWEFASNGHNGYVSFMDHENFERRPPEAFYNITERMKGMWLFHNFPVEDFHKRARDIIIERHDWRLDVTDYGVLIYISYNEDKVRKTLEGLPLSVLHAFYAPLIDDNFYDWLPKVFDYTKKL